MANSTRTQLSTDSLSLFPDNNSQLITPQDLRDWLTNGIESFVTQKDKSTFENAFYECRSSAITATSGTTNLALATGNFVHITGTGPISITSFGTLPAGSRFILCFDIAVTLVYNATTMILPGAANIVTAPGDSILLISEGGGNWRLIGYFPSAGLPVGTVTAVTASTPLSSTGGNAPDISISQAGASTDGYLSSTDWNTFNNKGNGTVTSITAGTGLNGGTITGSGTIDLANTTVTPNSYTNANITVDAQGRITAASNGSGGGGGTPGGSDTQIQYNNGGAFGGVSDLTWDDITNVLTINTPRIGQSNGNGHLHIHSANSAPSGITDYLTMFWQKATRVLGFRSELDTHETYIQLTAPTADRTLTLPDASGNVLVDTVLPVLNNGVSEGQIRLREAVASGSNYIGIKSPASLASDYTLTLPTSAPSTNQVLVSDISGTLSWNTGPIRFVNQFLRNYGAAITATGTEQLLQSIYIPANTYTDTTGYMIKTMITRSAPTSNTITVRLYINTANAIGGFNLTSNAISIGQSVSGFLQLERMGFIQIATGGSRNTIYCTTGGTLRTNNLQDAASATNSAIDWGVDQYVVISVVAANTSTITCNSLIIMPQ